jgi:hypothetical protein
MTPPRRTLSAKIFFACLCVDALAQSPPKLARQYREGEPVRYTMQGSNESPQRTIHYEAHANGTVRKNEAGTFVEDFGWSGLSLNGTPHPLSVASGQFREPLSLDPDYTLSVPDLSKVQPAFIGPITDLLTFYADVSLAMRQRTLTHPGDHVLVQHGNPNSWADGHRTLVGEDSIDFEIRLVSTDEATHTTKLLVRHIPPVHPQIKLLADWMEQPIAQNMQNNWVQLQRLEDGEYSAAVGAETFDVAIDLDTRNGAILSAHMQNPVDVVERICKDEALKDCAVPTRYRIHREITLKAE